MKNLLIYISPEKKFDKETERLAKIQIENSLELGWKTEDLLLVTNFPYEFMGVKATEIGDDNFCTILKQGTKVDSMVTLFKMKFFKSGELYWLHDFDAYQQINFKEKELGLESYQIGLTDYGRHERWNGGSLFFRYLDGEFFNWTKETMYKENINEEDAWMKMPEEFLKRVKRLNISYNFGIRKMKICYDKALKPIRILHFHPDRVYWGRTTAWDIVKGKNEVGIPIMNGRLISIFKKYGWN